MRKIGLVIGIIILLAGVSAQAQRRSQQPLPSSPPVPSSPPTVLSIQDQEGGGYLVFDVNTGEFKCNMCEYAFSFGGKGAVKIDGVNVTFSAVTDSYKVFVSLNMWDRQGRAVMETYQSPDGKLGGPKADLEYWTDLNLDDNLLECPPIK
jgi:hypothetical protein